MKKLGLVFACLLFLSACSSPQQQSDENVNSFFNAEVTCWGADDVLLSPVDIPDEEIDDQFGVLGEFAIPTATFEEHGITELKSGDIVRIVCSGLSENEDTESVSLKTVLSVYRVDADGNILDK